MANRNAHQVSGLETLDRPLRPVEEVIPGNPGTVGNVILSRRAGKYCSDIPAQQMGHCGSDRGVSESLLSSRHCLNCDRIAKPDDRLTSAVAATMVVPTSPGSALQGRP